MPPPDHAEYRDRRTFANLDGLRCLSIVAVLWYHVPRREHLPGALERGFLGVDLFFVLSGFLITTLLLREREKHGRISLAAFYMRRTLRIFPIYYLALLGYSLWVAWSQTAAQLHIRVPYFAALPYYATYTSNLVDTELTWRHTWSLATEEQFYLLWPPLLAWLGPRLSLWVLAAAFLITQALSFGRLDWLFAAGWHPEAAFVGATFAPILLGVMLAKLLHTRRGHGLAAGCFGAPWTGALLAGAVLAAASLPEGPGLELPSGLVHFRGLPRLLTHLAMALLLAHCVVQERTWLRGLLTLRPIAYLGRISYGIYLLHAPVFLVWYAGGFQWFGLPAPQLGLAGALGMFAAASLVTVAVAALSFHLVEMPFLRLKQRFERR
ncbi:MAG: acyltransferase [Planctomycetes bacterium]|nr:acyltransferase [Planctomycetota bacterium]